MYHTRESHEKFDLILTIVEMILNKTCVNKTSNVSRARERKDKEREGTWTRARLPALFTYRNVNTIANPFRNVTR